MSSEKSVAANTLVSELFQFGVYKKTQGKIARQATFGALAVTFALAAWRLWAYIGNDSWFPYSRFLLPAVVAIGGAWLAFRLVNYARFADFLIAVEAEMNKVSWPAKAELYRSAFVVIFVLFSLSFALFAFDSLWMLLFRLIGVAK